MNRGMVVIAVFLGLGMAHAALADDWTTAQDQWYFSPMIGLSFEDTGHAADNGYAASLGLGIYEMPRHMVKQDIEQMDLIVNWLDQQLMRSSEPGLMSRLNPWPKLFASATSGGSHPE